MKSFVRLSGPTGDVLIPAVADVVSITQSASNTYWLATRIPTAAGPIDKSFEVHGPADAILAALDAPAREAEEEAKARMDALHERERAELAARRELEDEHRAYLALHDEKQKLAAENEALREQVAMGSGPTEAVDWDAVERGSVPTLWSSYLLQRGANLNSIGGNRLFCTSQGNIGQGFQHTLSPAYTNIKEANRPLGGRSWFVFGLKVELLLGTQEDRETLIAASSLSFDFNQTSVSVCSLGAMAWDANRRTALYRFGTAEEALVMAQADTAKTQAEIEKLPIDPTHLGQSPVSRDVRAARILALARAQDQTFRFGEGCVKLPGDSFWGVVLSITPLGAGKPFRDSLQEPVIVRISLFGVGEELTITPTVPEKFTIR